MSAPVPSSPSHPEPGDGVAVPKVAPPAAPNAADDDGAPPPAPTGFLGDQKQRFDKEMDDYRRGMITALPPVVVNNASNFIGLAQIAADVAMFKSNGNALLVREKKVNGQTVTDRAPMKEFKAAFRERTFSWQLLKDARKFITYPMYNIFISPITRLKFGGKLSDLGKPGTYVDAFHNFYDLKAAGIADSKGGTVRLLNNMNTLSGLSAISVMTAGALLPESKQTDDETLAEVMLQKTNPVGYVGKQFARAVWFLPETAMQLVNKALHPDQQQGIGKHKHQFVGLGFLSSGVFSFLSGFRQVQGKIIGNQRYIRNGWQMGVGFFSTLAGWLLMNGVDAQQGWQGFGTGMISRNVTLPANIINRFQANEQGASLYMLGQGIFQVKNVFSAFVGGAQKLPDGTIVDQKKIRTKAKEEVREEIREKRAERLGWQQEDGAAPATSVTQPQMDGRAMAPPAQAQQAMNA